MRRLVGRVTGPVIGLAIGLLDWLRVHQPRAVTPLLVRFRATLTWARPAERERARAAMRLLVPERSEAEITALARRHVWFTCLRSEQRYHPRDLLEQEVTGLEHLAAARAHGRGVVLGLLHHGHFAGSFSSVAAQGFPITIVGVLGPPDGRWPTWMRYFLGMVSAHDDVDLVDVQMGFRGMVEVLREGKTFSITCDGPGRGPSTVEFLGREWQGFTTAAGLAFATGAPIVPMTSWRSGRTGGRVGLGAPLHPEDYTDADAMTRALLAAFEESVRAWPDGYDLPLEFWVPAGSDRPADG